MFSDGQIVKFVDIVDASGTQPTSAPATAAARTWHDAGRDARNWPGQVVGGVANGVMGAGYAGADFIRGFFGWPDGAPSASQPASQPASQQAGPFSMDQFHSNVDALPFPNSGAAGPLRVLDADPMAGFDWTKLREELQRRRGQ